MHTDVQALLRSKNRCLSQLILITEETLRASSTSNALSNLEQLLPRFDQKRSAVFKAIELVDRELQKVESTPGAGLESLIQEQQQLVKNLQGLDSKLLEAFEAAIQSGQREIHQTLQSREKLNRFKSTPASESGEGLDQTL